MNNTLSSRKKQGYGHKGDTKTDYAILLAILAVIMSITVAFPVSFNPTRT
jgi:uncharacterized protein (UPF0333 family)